MNVHFKADVPSFVDQVNKKAAAFGIKRDEAFRIEGRLLAKELIDRTPPFSGKVIKKILGSQGTSLTNANADIDNLTARKVGERRVEKDIKKIILGVKSTVKQQQPANPDVIVSQTRPDAATHSNDLEWGIRQKVEGRNAIRVYADRQGNVYGVDEELFMPSASMRQLEQHHRKFRNSRGRVTTAGSKDRIVGRWKWITKLVTAEPIRDTYIKFKKKMVGEGKGGWVDGFAKLGGKISASGWIGRHRKSGTAIVNTSGDKIRIELTNRSQWASGGDPDGVIERSLAGRAASLKAAIERELKKAWGKGRR